jgi:hypothetical protein
MGEGWREGERGPSGRERGRAGVGRREELRMGYGFITHIYTVMFLLAQDGMILGQYFRRRAL